MKYFLRAKRIVVKVGTSTLTHDTGKPNLRRMRELVRVLSDLKNAGRDVVLVTSGAIAVGVGKLNLERRPRDIGKRQALAAVGQCELMYIYDKLFSDYGHVTAQVLLTRDCVEEPIRNFNVRNAFECIFDLGAIPVVNENDTVAVEEIVFGDNDNLSAVVAKAVCADALVILTDIDGLHEENPRTNPAAKLIPVVEKITGHTRDIAGGTGSSRGTGGMITKIEAADIATRAGIATAIIDGSDPDNLYRLLDGEPVGTVFLPQREAQS